VRLQSKSFSFFGGLVVNQYPIGIPAPACNKLLIRLGIGSLAGVLIGADRAPTPNGFLLRKQDITSLSHWAPDWMLNHTWRSFEVEKPHHLRLE